MKSLFMVLLFDFLVLSMVYLFLSSEMGEKYIPQMNYKELYSYQATKVIILKKDLIMRTEVNNDDIRDLIQKL